ncbi:MAG: CoA activase [Deltaproteobacteria bacterium]|nr:CoA activase [Deltaproteobacteria bacterium]MBW1736306.1 CoA activase [Deltaproteobacteria bacterium]MBW1908792.1 CoA activase [Deltaproteobacteria bacterium]MBW2032714.1 CoA activase [Deltaproteobacteria bacterium]MBW2113538.1 CoA activase [Deltaproteobacteria bacterium]
MESNKVVSFKSLSENVGRFDLKNKTFLVPQMNRIGTHLLAATFMGFGIDAVVMETYKGLDLGMEYTSGKECYPCQITTGDILYFMKKEKERLGHSFNPEDYIYFMPESDGPCRFGMYNKYQRIVLDSFPELSRVKIGSLTTKDGYSLDGIIEKERVRDLRKVAYFSVVVADILDRLLWRIRPYERETGMTDDFIEESMHVLEGSFKTYGTNKKFDKILDKLEEIVEEGKTIIDFTIPPKPLIGIVGEIYLRTQVHANQDVIRVLERYGAEVVNASIAEWVNYTTYDKLRDARIGFRLNLKQLRFGPMRDHLKKILGFGGELLYQESKQKKVYKRVRSLIDLAEDHKVAHLENILKEEDLFCFDAGTEACLSIPGIVEYARQGYNGVVNVYPFTCMPSTVTSAIVKPLMNKLRIPYLDTPYDSSFQPGREAAIRTFMYQAHQHLKRNGRKNLSGHR